MSDATVSLFGIGADGIPKKYQAILREDGGPEGLARSIIEDARAEFLGESKPGTRLQSGEIRSAAFVLLEWYSAHGVPVPPVALEAVAFALSLVSPDRFQPLAPKVVRAQLGYPTGIRLKPFMDAAGRDAIALALKALAEQADPADLSTLAHEGRWVLRLTPLSKIVNLTAAVLRGYRIKSEYRATVANFATWILYGWQLSGKATRKTAGNVDEIERRVLRLPKTFILQKVGDSDEFLPITMTPALRAISRNLQRAASRLVAAP